MAFADSTHKFRKFLDSENFKHWVHTYPENFEALRKSLHRASDNKNGNLKYNIYHTWDVCRAARSLSTWIEALRKCLPKRIEWNLPSWIDVTALNEEMQWFQKTFEFQTRVKMDTSALKIQFHCLGKEASQLRKRGRAGIGRDLVVQAEKVSLSQRNLAETNDLI